MSGILRVRTTKRIAPGRAWLPRLAAELIHAEAQNKFPLETGGILMGYWAEADVVITHAVGPGPNATHGKISFIPDAQYQEGEVARIYEESGRLSTYLGDWHTHPRGSTRMSRRDRRTLRRIASSTEARCPKPLMALCAGGKKKWLMGVWVFKKAGYLVKLLGYDLAPLRVIFY